MIGTILGAVMRLMQLQKLAQYSGVQAAYGKAKAWFEAQPREIQVMVVVGALVALGTVLFA